jgi:hypothetical protein
MIDIDDPRNEHILAHPHFLSGVEHGIQQERERCTKKLRDFARELTKAGQPSLTYLLASDLIAKEDQ